MKGAIVACCLLAASVAHSEEPLTLAQAIVLARSHHPTVDIQRAQVDIARARTEQAIALLTPGLTGGFGYAPQTANYVADPAVVRQLASTSGADTVVDAAGMPVSVTCRTPGVGNCAVVGASPSSSRLYDYWTAGVGVTWTAWDWGHSIYAVRSASTQGRAAAVGVVTAQHDVGLDVKLAYFAVLAAAEQRKVGQESVQDYQAHLAQIEAFHGAGLRTGIDVATAQSALASAEVTLARADAGFRAAQAQLMLALGEGSWKTWQLQPSSELFSPSASDEAQAQETEPRLIDAGVAHRTELLQLHLQSRSYGELEKSARGQYLPQLTLQLGATWAGTSLDNLVPNFDVMVMLGYPVLGMNPLAVDGQTREAAAHRMQTEAQLRAERDSVRQEVVTTRAMLASALDELRSSRTLVEAAKRQRDLAEGRYQSGVGNVIELSDALLNYVNARFALVQAGYDFASSKARLLHAIGDPG